MNVEDVILLEDNREYLILDTAKYNNEKYLYCVGMDEEEKPTTEYIYLKANEKKNGEYSVENIEDKNVIDAILTMFASNYLNDNTYEEQDV